MAGKTTNITITAAPRKKKAEPKQGKEVRHGPFTRIDDDPITPDNPPVLLVTYFDLDFNVFTKAYSIQTPALPKQPKPTANVVFLFTAREKTVGFPLPQGYGFVSSQLAALSLAKPRAPVLTSSLAIASGESVVEEGVLYLVSEAKISAVDVTDPAAIALIHTYDAVADFTAKQRYVGRPAVLNQRLYVASFPDIGGTAGGDGEMNSYLATYDFDSPGSATQIDAIVLEASAAAGMNSFATQKPPVILGDGVLYLSFQYKDTALGNTYTTKLKTYSLATPDSPAEVHSLNVEASGAVTGFFATPSHEYAKLWINKAKTRLFLLTTTQTLTGTLWMYDIETDPEAPALLDSVPFEYDQNFAQSAVYPSDTGFVYVGTFAPTPAIEVYDISADTFVLANTVAVSAESQAYVVYALDKKGFPL